MSWRKGDPGRAWRLAVGRVPWEAGSGPCTLGGWWWAVYAGREVVGRVHWEDLGGPCTLGGRR